MAFWGVEVKPGIPVTHSCEKARGRLRISQATLGFGESLKSSVVQCNVGNRSPVLLCVLLPGRVESSHIELEFQEADDVVFSVLGPRSVHLTGYYVHESWQSNHRSDTESYGVDIEHSPADQSNHNSDDVFVDDDDDGYEDSFINDDELRFSSPGSPVFCSKGMDEVMLEEDEVMLEKDEKKNKKVRSKQRRKRQCVIESDNDASSPNKEDEAGEMGDESERDAKTTTRDAGEMDDEAKDDVICGTETKQKVDPLHISDKIERATELSLDEERAEVYKMLALNQAKELSLDEERAEVYKMLSLNQDKPREKRKECPLTEGTSETQTDNEDPSVPRECNEHESEASADLMRAFGDHLTTALELNSANGPRSKRRRNELLEGELTGGTGEKVQNSTEELFEQGSIHTNNVTEHLPAENEECEQQQMPQETSLEKCGLEFHNVRSGDEVMQEGHADRKTDDLPADFMQEVCAERKADDLPAEVMREEHADRNINDLPAEVMQEEHADRNIDDLPAEVMQEELADRNIDDLPAEVMQEEHADRTDDLPAANGDNKEGQIDRSFLSTSELPANASQPDKIKKKKKNKVKKDLNTSEIQMSDNQDTENESNSTQVVGIDTRTLSNGLIIKELESGPPGGRVAVTGKKIKIFYTGRLKESGIVYDTNVGKAAYKFQLGDKEFIDGWNVGIEGMRVGDKRRLIIPPSMGYGDLKVGDSIPPNSWIIYDIELVRVYR